MATVFVDAATNRIVELTDDVYDDLMEGDRVEYEPADATIVMDRPGVLAVDDTLVKVVEYADDTDLYVEGEDDEFDDEPEEDDDWDDDEDEDDLLLDDDHDLTPLDDDDDDEDD